MWSSIFNAVLPAPCALCREPSDGFGLCDACAHDLPLNTPACTSCAQPIKQAGMHCGACQQNLPKWQKAVVPFVYKEAVKYLIYELKFNNKTHIAKTLARQFIAQTRNHLSKKPEAIIPVPLHKKRLTSRQFNQSGLIAKSLGHALQIPVWEHIAKRQINTESQNHLSQKQRLINMRDAFAIRNGGRITGKHIVLVDDVYTTGATLNALCLPIEKYKPAQTDIWCIARTIK